MRIPAEIQGEWSSLSRTDNRSENLRSLEKIRAWLDKAAGALAVSTPRTAQKEPKMFGHSKTNAAGITSVEFDGVDMATLRFWEQWWSDPSRTRHGREEAGRDPTEQVARIRLEIEARERP